VKNEQLIAFGTLNFYLFTFLIVLLFDAQIQIHWFSRESAVTNNQRKLQYLEKLQQNQSQHFFEWMPQCISINNCVTGFLLEFRSGSSLIFARKENKCRFIKSTVD
jgi:hypothetical protein